VEVLSGAPLTSKVLLAQEGALVSWRIKVNAARGNVISNCAVSLKSTSSIYQQPNSLID